MTPCKSALLTGLALLSLNAAAAPDLEPGPVLDPHYGQVLFDFYKADYLDAIVELLAAQSRNRLPNHEDDAELLLGGMYLSYGLHHDAARIFDELLATRTNPSVRDRTWFYLAKIRYQRGYLEESLQALQAIESELPEDLEPERRMMYSQVLMAMGRYNDAAQALDRWKTSSNWYHFATYNLGVALVRAGDIQNGATILEGIGGRGDDSNDNERLDLQDKANVALGFAYLQNKQPLEAKAALQRVRLEGPYSNKALLGVGWADAELENYRRALAPWLELRGRDLLDPAVQESLLAIPFAYSKLDANNEAAQQYLIAIESYVDETQRLDAAIDRIESGEVVTTLLADDPNESTGWLWQLESVPDTYESRYLYHLLARHEFQEALKNFRDLKSLRKNLETWRESFEVFTNMLDTRQRAFTNRLPDAKRIMEKADLDALERRRAALEASIEQVDSDTDVVEFATPRERRLWADVTELSATPALQADLPEAVDPQKKLRLLRGVLLWEMEGNFPARVWRQKKDLREISRALDQARELRDQAAAALVSEPENLTEFAARIRSLAPRIDSLIARLIDLTSRQQEEVNRIAVGELEARKKRLDTYTVQARFALAGIYDRASDLGTR